MKKVYTQINKIPQVEMPVAEIIDTKDCKPIELGYNCYVDEEGEVDYIPIFNCTYCRNSECHNGRKAV